jgi:26S proteasome non-ATPase regulatory subunit 9
MKTPLVDAEGFPRADIDIYAIRTARSALAPLYNDLTAKEKEIETALHYLNSLPVDNSNSSTDQPMATSKPFAKVNGVAPDSPADESGLKRGDLVLAFGLIDSDTPSPLQKIAIELPNQEFVRIFISNC